MESQEKILVFCSREICYLSGNFFAHQLAAAFDDLDMRLLFVNLHLRMILMPCFLRFLGKNIVQYLILIPCCHGLRWMTEHR